MSTTTDGAHVEVTVRLGDPLTVTNEPCHTSRVIESSMVRQMMRAFGVRCCPECHAVTSVATRRGWRER